VKAPRQQYDTRKEMSNSIKFYLVDGILVEATETVGGGFYDVTVIKTGHKFRIGKIGFESVARPTEAQQHES
jgi:hypothetical protein